MHKQKPQIVIVDFGSQYTSIIARTLAELGIRSVIISPEKLDAYLAEHEPKALILSGGNSSVYDEQAPGMSASVLSGNYFILGICYGMQLIAHMLDQHSVTSGDVSQKGYGSTEVFIADRQGLFEGMGEKMYAWASHGDVVAKVPAGFRVAATSGRLITVIESIASCDGKTFGVQFHPEVPQTEDDNLILKNFAKLSGCIQDWSPEDSIQIIRDETLASIGDGKALLGASGGVDSTTLAAILAPELGEKLVTFIIDHGAMRKGEIGEVSETMKRAGIPLEIIDAGDFFLQTMGNAIDPEEKRARFMKAYAETFERIIRERKITRMIQGTLATDLIESAKKGKSALIKSHHNIVDFSVAKIEPFSDLFKYEVRAIAKRLGLDAMISERKPFPGPGIYLRILGVPVTRERIEIVQWADEIVTNILIQEDCYDSVSQLVVALDGTKTTGVKGDSGVLGYSIIVRPVTTSDFMTVKPLYLAPGVMERVTSEITKHASVNRVFWDYTSKPPATTEFQ